MKIKSITINNFRSVRNLTLPIKSYGTGESASKAAFLVGVNESGKSAILDAINIVKNGMSNLSYENNCFVDAQDEDEDISIRTEIDIEWGYHSSFWRKQINAKLKLDEKFISNLEIINVCKVSRCSSDVAYDYFEITVNSDLPFFSYMITTIEEEVNGTKRKLEKIENIASFNKVSDIVTEANANDFLSDNQTLLTKEKLENYLANILKPLLEHNLPKIQIWKSKPEYLINEVIDLNEFKEDTSISIPLKNIFYIYGKTNDSEIKSAIEKALKDQARCDELQEKMSERATKYINKIWKEHRIKLKISINSNLCKVHVEDNDKKFSYYTMDQRSDGFKQFLSLILSLSVQNETKNLTNNVILIDEPEIHLHPSGIKYLRDEILKIGKNNVVIVSTHSQYMIDTEVVERHWIVQKKKSETFITQISEDVSITDDKVIAAAFGLNLFKELLPKNIIVVEGSDDKNLLAHSFYHLNNSFKCSIKNAGGATKIPGFARLLSDESVAAILLFDADKEGRENMKKIIELQSESYSKSNVFTLKDIVPELPTEATIEDLMPCEFVKKFFEKELEQAITLAEDKAFIHQLKNQSKILKENKQKLDSLKNKLSEAFCNKYHSATLINAECHRVVSFVQKFVDSVCRL